MTTAVAVAPRPSRTTAAATEHAGAGGPGLVPGLVLGSFRFSARNVLRWHRPRSAADPSGTRHWGAVRGVTERRLTAGNYREHRRRHDLPPVRRNRRSRFADQRGRAVRQNARHVDPTAPRRLPDLR